MGSSLVYLLVYYGILQHQCIYADRYLNYLTILYELIMSSIFSLTKTTKLPELASLEPFNDEEQSGIYFYQLCL